VLISYVQTKLESPRLHVAACCCTSSPRPLHQLALHRLAFANPIFTHFAHTHTHTHTHFKVIALPIAAEGVLLLNLTADFAAWVG